MKITGLKMLKITSTVALNLFSMFTFLISQQSFAENYQIIAASNHSLIDLSSKKEIFTNTDLSIHHTTKISEKKYAFQGKNRGAYYEIHLLELNKNITHKKVLDHGYCPTAFYNANYLFFLAPGKEIGSIDLRTYNFQSEKIEIIYNFKSPSYIDCPIVVNDNKILLKVPHGNNNFTYYYLNKNLEIDQVDFKGYMPELSITDNTFLAWKDGYVIINEQLEEVHRLAWQQNFSKAKSGAFLVSGYSKKLNQIFFIENKFSIFSGEYYQTYVYDISKKSYSKFDQEIPINIGGILE